MTFEGFPLLAFYVPPPSLPSSASLSVLRWTFRPQPASPCVCALNSSHCSFEGQSHKTSFYAGLVSLMGLSLCTMLRSKPQKLQTGMTTPTQPDRQMDRRTDRQTPRMMSVIGVETRKLRFCLTTNTQALEKILRVSYWFKALRTALVKFCFIRLLDYIFISSAFDVQEALNRFLEGAY